MNSFFPARRLFAAFCLMAAVLAGPAAGAPESPSAQTVWRLLDYIAVDYPAAVRDGAVINDLEYGEMQEFAEAARMRLMALPPVPGKGDLLRRAGRLKTAIAQKAGQDRVADLARGLAADLLAAYPIAAVPAKPPDLARGQKLYAEQCASCHGMNGAGDGPESDGMDPTPIAFTDQTRAAERSLFGLYQVITQGIDETAMVAFDGLSAEDRWALAFYVGTLAFPEEGRGKNLWESGTASSAGIASLEDLTHVTPAALAEKTGRADAFALTAYLRRHPAAVVEAEDDRLAVDGGSLTLARTRLTESRQAYQAGDPGRAKDLALSAYLDGFEPLEATLSARNGALMRRIENAMVTLRTRIADGAPPAQVGAQVDEILGLMDAAERTLADDTANASASFAGAFTILLREGLEALLIVVAMIAFLKKAERPDVRSYVHAGWIAALAAGVATWWAATSIISVSGAGREITEGFGAILAAVVLVSVGVWMHGKSQAGAWQQYIRAKMADALSKRSAWFLFLLAFIVVYREAFETILFFMALWSQGNGIAILAGTGAAVAILAGIAWALLAYSVRLPIGQFFRLSALLIAALAVVLAGKGVAALQEAGWIAVSPFSQMPRVEILGFYPTWEGLAAQIATLVILAAAFWYNRRAATPAAS